MSFNSLHFLFLFLPIFLTLYFILPARIWRNAILLVGSLIFYAWGNPLNILFLLASILLNWGLAVFISKAQQRQQPRVARLAMLLAVAFNLFSLLFYKYADFFLHNLGALLNCNLSVSLPPMPLGISFITFSGIAYIVDVYREVEKAQVNPFHTALYIAMFPKIMQGPITRLGTIRTEITSRTTSLADAAEGSRRFVSGLAKKVLIADNLAIVSTRVFNADLTSIGADLAWFAIVAYALQIYFDFSGYTDMAVGVGLILGFHLPENFNYPYISRSITDFWRRWHMSLTTWFRVYIFMPLEIARRRAKHLRQQTHILIVFLLTGLWHGANWNFILWGMYFGLIMAMEASFLGKWLKKRHPVFQHSYALLLILIGWVFFRLENIHMWKPFFRALLGGNGAHGSLTGRSLNLLPFLPLLALAAFLSTPVLQTWGKKQSSFPVRQTLVDVLWVGLFILSAAFLVANGYNAFVYAQF